MIKDKKDWWKNPKDHIFWLVYTPVVFLLISIVFNILFLLRPIPISYLLQEQFNPTKMKDTVSSTGLEGPRKLQELLDKYPIIQGREIFRRFYFGKEVIWKGTLLVAIKNSRLFFQINHGDSSYLSESPPSFHLDESGNITLEESKIVFKDVYVLYLMNPDGCPFSANIEAQGNEHIDYLNKGDTLEVKGILVSPNEIVNISKLPKTHCEY